VLSAVLGRRVMTMPVPWTALSRAGLGAGVMAAAVLAIPAWGGWSELLTKAATGAVVYGAVMLALDGRLRGRLRTLARGAQARIA
jgi:hypothetical protein